MKRNLLLFFLALLPMLANAYDAEIDGIYYNFSGNEAEVTGAERNEVWEGSWYHYEYYSDYSGAVVIPASVNYFGNTYSVSSIGEGAFSNCRDLTSVTIPNSVTSIVDYAFRGCCSLTSITIPNSVTSIPDYAFSGCSGLTSITIPNSVTSIGYAAFYGCSDLVSITVGNSVRRIEYNAFGETAWYKNQPDGLVYAGKVAYKYKGTMPTGTHITIKEGTIGIADGAFYGCSGLTSITIPESVSFIFRLIDYNSYDCYGSFKECSNLISVTIESDAIGSASSMKSLFGEQVKEYVIGNSVKNIGNNAFSGCSSLTSITIGSSVTSIGSSAFSGCSGLTSVTLKSNTIVSASRTSSTSMKSIFGDQVKTYFLGETVKNIGNYAFYGCSKMSSITFGSSLTTIGQYAFSGCTGLTAVSIPKSVTSVGSYAFNGCSGLKKVSVSDLAAWCGISFGNFYANPLYYARHLYSGNESSEITNLFIPEGVTSIGERAFTCCSSLTSVTIPESVTNIKSYGFYNCSSLKDVYCYAEDVPNTGSDVFYGMDMGKSILHVPAGSINQYKATEPWSKFGTIVILEDDTEVYAYIDGIFYSLSNNRATVTYGVPKYSGSVVIPESISFYNKTYPVTTIGNSAFRDCTDLTAVTIPKSVTSLGESVFRGCDSLTDIVVAQGNSIYDSRENCNAIIETNSNMLVVGCRNTTIPSSVKAIRGQAFYGYTGLTHITIPDNVNTIGHKAFGDCTGLTSVTIGKGVNYIDDAFAGCTSLASVTLESNAIVSATRTSSTSMKSVFGEQVTEYIIGNEVEQIGNYAFYGCSRFPSVTIPENVTSIGSYAFYGCSGLTAITIPENVTNIGSQAFNGCKLHNILVKGETPPSFTSDPFSQNIYNHTSLYIPYGSWDDYIFGSNWYKFINIRETATAGEQVSLQQAYMLMDAETFAYFVYDPVSDGIVSISSSSNIDGDNPNHSWLAEQIDGQMCLYNVGAGKFAVPTSDGSLTLSSSPAIIEVENGEGGILFDGKTEHQWAFVCNDRMNAEAIITGIKDSKDSKDFVDSWHSLDGRRLSAPQKGINIVRYSDGTTRKVLVK